MLNVNVKLFNVKLIYSNLFKQNQIDISIIEKLTLNFSYYKMTKNMSLLMLPFRKQGTEIIVNPS